ncbi:MAG: DUF4394 domain-containing protein [Coleofasciculus sp. S288]|nr:DUF4394 domain-containing protein [Coleofasciculus sp. S288]
MKLNKLGTIITALTVATMFDFLSIAKPAGAASIKLIGLTDSNTLVSFDPNNPTKTKSVGVTGVQGNLLGIDFRASNGQLFGVTDANSVYTIDPNTGVATLVLTPNAAPFTLDGNSFGVDFNPNPDAIRVVSDAEQNLRLNANTGGLALNAPDRSLAYAAGDSNANANPNIVAQAYTNSFAPSPDPTRRTTLYGIDSNLDILVTQGSVNFLPGDPAPAVSPNTGQLFTVGSLNVDFGSQGGFDIFSTKKGNDITNTAFAASGSTLYDINLKTGRATTLGTIGNGNAKIIGLAATSVPEPGTVGSLIGFGVLALVSCRYRRDKSVI